MSFKKLSEILTSPDNSKETYITDQKWRKKRSYRGEYSKSQDIFDFIYLIQAWEEIVGKMLSSNTKPLKINKKVLFIIVKHPVFSNELKFMVQMIIDKIVEKFPKLQGHITQIKFINSEGFFKPVQGMEIEKKAKKTLHPFSPEVQMKKFKADQLFDDVEDLELKQLFIDLYLDK